jgi:CheY-like chemotaxis protein
MSAKKKLVSATSNGTRSKQLANGKEPTSKEAPPPLHDTLEQRICDPVAVAERHADDLRRLTLELGNAEYGERQRLSRILHDDLQGLLLAIRLRLTDIDRAESGRLRTKIRAIDELLDECMGTSQDLARELSPPLLREGTLVEMFRWLGDWFRRKHSLTVAVDAREELPSTPPPVRLQLFLAVRELLTNVVKHSGVMEACVSLCLRDGYLSIQVDDGGSWFDPNAAQEKLRQALTFGLFSVRGRLEAIKGRLEIKSTPKGGGCFRLIIPIDDAAEPQTEQASTERCVAGEQPRGKAADRVRLLVVDDHKVVRESLILALQREECFEIVGEAADGDEAIRRADALRPDAIVMDVEMANLNGIEATRQIKRRLPDVVVVGLTFHEDDAVAQAIAEAGALACLSKRCRIADLVEAIRRGCGAV